MFADEIEFVLSWGIYVTLGYRIALYSEIFIHII